MAASLLISLLLLSLISLSSPLSSETILEASEILSNSGYVSMALTLELVSKTLTVQSPSLTIFAPPDAAFSKSGQPSLSLLQLHFCPLPLSLKSLKSLPSATKIPTLLPNHMLIVTSSPSDSQFSLNNVKITTSSPIYDDGSLVIFGIEGFFDPNFQVPSIHNPPSCRSFSSNDDPIQFPGESWLKQASSTLSSNGYSVMASFLDSQLLGFNEQSAMTIFAPSDEAMANRPDPTQNPSIFLRHVVPCKLLWNDLVNFSDGSVLQTYLDRFNITISRSGSVLLVNGVPVFYANMYYSHSLVVHGLSEILGMQKEAAESESKSSSGSSGSKVEDIILLENEEF
ncbi:hypothetical protein UlMin_040776 [Ulmus minor]